MDYIKEFADVVVNLIVIALGIKRRVNITKVNRFITNEFAENVEIVAVVEFIHKVYLQKHARSKCVLEFTHLLRACFCILL